MPVASQRQVCTRQRHTALSLIGKEQSNDQTAEEQTRQSAKKVTHGYSVSGLEAIGEHGSSLWRVDGARFFGWPAGRSGRRTGSHHTARRVFGHPLWQFIIQSAGRTTAFLFTGCPISQGAPWPHRRVRIPPCQSLVALGPPLSPYLFHSIEPAGSERPVRRPRART